MSMSVFQVFIIIHHRFRKNLAVLKAIHLAINKPQRSKSIPRKATPDHDVSSSKLDGALCVLRIESLVDRSTHVAFSIIADHVELAFIRPEHILPIFHSPVQMLLCELQPFFDILRRNPWLLCWTSTKKTNLNEEYVAKMLPLFNTNLNETTLNRSGTDVVQTKLLSNFGCCKLRIPL